MHSETTRKQKISTLFISTFSLMCSIYRHVCSVFFLKYDIYKQPLEHASIRYIGMVGSQVIYVERDLT